MSWRIHHVNIPAHNVPKSAAFYREALGMAEAPWQFPANPRVVSQDPARLTLFPTATGAMGPNPGLHLVKPDAGFAAAQDFVHNPTVGGHVAYQTEDLERVIARLAALGVPYTTTEEAAIPGVRQVYCYDPSMNLLEVNGLIDPATAEPTGPEAAPWRIHHVNVPAHDVRESAAFYCDVVGMAEAPWSFPANRGAISSDPARLTLMATETAAQGANSGLHLIRPDARFAIDNRLDHNPSIGGHVAYQVPDLDAVAAALDAAKVPYSMTGEFAIPGMRHLYCYDPAMNLIEVNEMLT